MSEHEETPLPYIMNIMKYIIIIIDTKAHLISCI